MFLRVWGLGIGQDDNNYRIHRIARASDDVASELLHRLPLLLVDALTASQAVTLNPTP